MLDRNKVLEICRQAQELNPIEAQVLACMVIDIAAKKIEREPAELMDDLRPLVESVYRDMGFDGV